MPSTVRRTSAGAAASAARILLFMDGHLALGRYGEELASRYLRDRGMLVLERNWRCPEGEIDIVALDGDCLVVCEVKTRAGTGVGDPLEAVTRAKASRLRRLAAAYLRSRPGSVARARIDVIGVLAERGRPPVVRHVVAVGS